MRRLLALACFALLACAPEAQGATPWLPIGVPGGLSNVMFAPGAGSSVLYARSQTNWWRSDDDGATWAIGGGIDQGSGYQCVPHISPADASTLYSGCEFFSTDGGVHWAAFPTLSNLQIDAAGTVYAVDQAGIGTLVKRCTPSGASCTTAVAPGQDAVVVDPASQGFIVRQATDGVAASGDAGATWTAPHPLPAHLLTTQLSFDGRVPHKLVVIGRRDDTDLPVMAVSADAGATWSALRTLPFQPDTIDGAGGSGAQRRLWIQKGTDAAWTSDDGVTFHAIHADGPFAVDPDDGAHLFLSSAALMLESRDGGASWSLRNSTQFGYRNDTARRLTGSGSTLYSSVDGLAWVSHDAGITWSLLPGFEDWRISQLLASRDDPAVVYAIGANATTTVLWQTLDGGQTWAARTPPPPGAGIAWIESGHPDWLEAGGGGNPVVASHDGGRTWGSVPPEATCWFGADGFKPVSPVSCWSFVVDPLRAPWDQAFGAAQNVLIDHSGGGSMYSLAPLGRVAADWSFTPACAGQRFATYCLGEEQNGADISDAWAAGGHVTYAVVHDGVWARRDDSRWFLLQPPAATSTSQASYAANGVLLLSHSRLAANGQLIPLQAPEVGTPKLSLVTGPVHCSVSVTADAADLVYSWRRDAVTIAGETKADHLIVPADEGHALSCVVQASNAWGSATGTSAPFAVTVTGAAGTRGRLALTGTAGVGDLLRCGAARGIGWLRGAKLLKGLHARTYRVVALDEGHTVACQSHPSGGTLTRSAALHVPAPHGGRAAPVAATP